MSEGAATPARLSPVKAIRTYCLAHCEHPRADEGKHGTTWYSRGYCVTICAHVACPLWPYRQGTNPGRAGIGGRSKGIHR